MIISNEAFIWAILLFTGFSLGLFAGVIFQWNNLRSALRAMMIVMLVLNVCTLAIPVTDSLFHFIVAYSGPVHTQE